MDVVSDTANVLALLKAARKCSIFIYTFFRSFNDGLSDIGDIDLIVKALHKTLSSLHLLCETTVVRGCDTSRLLSNTTQCLADIQKAEERIRQINQNLANGGIPRTWSRVQWAFADGQSWLSKFSERVKLWQGILTNDFFQLQINLYQELQTSVSDGNKVMLEMLPLVKMTNEHVLRNLPSSSQSVPFESCLQSMQEPTPLPVRLAKKLQTFIEPAFISGRSYMHADVRALKLSLRHGYIVVQRWTSKGEAVYEILKSSPGYAIEISAQFTWIVPLRLSFLLFLTARSLEKWTLSTAFQLTTHRIVPINAEIVSAVRRGDRGSVINLFKDKRARPTDVLADGHNLVHVATKHNRLEVLILLLNEGASLNATTDTGDTALHLAVREKVDYDVARTLIDNGADLESRNGRKQTPLHSFFNPLVGQIVPRHASSLEDFSADTRGMNLAHYFGWSKSSTPSDFQHLPDLPSLLNQSDSQGRKPVHLAVERGNLPVVEYLLSQSTSSKQSMVDFRGNTLMHFAVKSVRAPDTISLLLKHGLRLDVRNLKGHTPLQFAACFGTTEALSYLLDLDPSSIDVRDASGNDLLTLARRVENEINASWLLLRYGEDLQVEESNQMPSHGKRSILKGLREKAFWILCVLVAPTVAAFLLYMYLK